MSWFAQTVEVEPYQMLRQMRRTVEEIKKDSPCVGVCTLNEDDICIGCDRHIGDIIERGETKLEEYRRKIDYDAWEDVMRIDNKKV